MTEKATTKIWDPYQMMSRAKALRRLAEHLDDDGTVPNQWDGRLQEGRFVAVPVLLALATEIALKAWKCHERNGRPEQTHDLLELFLGLGKDAQRRLSEKMPEYPSPVPGLPPAYPGIQTALSNCRNIFVEWRYSHEHRHLRAETGVLKTALNAIIEVYDESTPGPA